MQKGLISLKFGLNNHIYFVFSIDVTFLRSANEPQTPENGNQEEEVQVVSVSLGFTRNPRDLAKKNR